MSFTSPRSAVALLAAMIGLFLLAFSSPARAETVSITQGSVEWGFKQSWRTYIGEAGITVSDGATRTVSGNFNLPVESGTFDTETKALSLDLAGTIHFTAHDGLLDSTLRDPRLLLSGDAAEIRFDIHSKNMAGDWVQFEDAPLSVLDAEAVDPVIADGKTTWNAIPNAITQQGADAFTYAAGTVLDPLTISYEGPGGKPSFAETWTAPGTFKYEKSSTTELLPSPSAASWITEAFFDRPEGVVHSVAVPTGLGANYLMAIDLETGQPKAQIGPLAGSRYAYDPDNHTVFVSGQSTVTAYTWDTEEEEYSSEVIQSGVPSGLVTYNRATETLAHLTGTGQLILAKRNESGGFTIEQKTVTGVMTPNVVQLDERGTLLYAHSRTGSRVHQIDVNAANPVAQAVDGVGTLAFTQVVLGEPGVAWAFGTTPSNQRLQKLVRAADGTYSTAGELKPMPQAASAIKTSPDGQRLYGLSPYFNSINVFDGNGDHRGTIETVGTVAPAENKQFVEANANGSLLVVTPDPSLARPNATQVPWPMDVYALEAVSPTITGQPQDVQATVPQGQSSVPVEFSVEAEAVSGIDIRWQSRVGGIGRFSDLNGQTEAELRIDAGKSNHGTEYRAVLSNAAGSIATELASLSVRYAPEITQQPVSVGVDEGGDATLKVMPIGNPHPTVTWERKQAGFWVPVQPDGIDIVVSGEGNGFLTIKNASAEQSGTVLRAVVANAVGTVYSNQVTLTVEPALTQKVTFGSGHVEWGFANRWRCYITGNVARGGIEITGGITRVPGTTATGSLCPANGAGSEALRFPVLGDSYDPATGRLEVRLAGTVRFWGHTHHRPGDTTPQLDMTFSKLRVVLNGSSGSVIADSTGATMDDPTVVERKGVVLAAIDATGNGPSPTGTGLGWAASPTTLTATGREVFGDYPEGEPFDPISMNLIYGTPVADPDPEPDPDPDPEPVVRAKITSPAKAKATRRTRVATIACPAGAPCSVKVPKRVKIKVAGKAFKLKVGAPTKIAAGKRAQVNLRLGKPVLKRLKGRSAQVKLRMVVTRAGESSARVVKVKLKGAPRRR